jgi:hypothetical protein
MVANGRESMRFKLDALSAIEQPIEVCTLQDAPWIARLLTLSVVSVTHGGVHDSIDAIPRAHFRAGREPVGTGPVDSAGTDPQLAAKVRDVVGLYLHPPGLARWPAWVPGPWLVKARFGRPWITAVSPQGASVRVASGGPHDDGYFCCCRAFVVSARSGRTQPQPA